MIILSYESYQDRQYSANCSSSFGVTPSGVADLLRRLGGGVGLPFLTPRERPENEGEPGETIRLVDLGLVGGDIEVAEGRS